jgi:hypothetical protein
MNKDKALERLTALESEAAELRKIIEQPEGERLWRPEMGDIYFTVEDDGDTLECRLTSNSKGSTYSVRLDHGNVFQCEEQAKKAAPLMARANKIIAAALQVDPDAGKWAEDRSWCVLKTNKKWCVSHSGFHQEIIHVHTEEQAVRMAEILNNEGI